ncbi:hypothetical protein V9T40_008511 [Parthenolecanium corni]|uniref:THAP-type domain-containing protein n=1 Tax=Parthenolecanium corni TaxID=536013 RepID=A0AAN9TKW2_9HEMI
MTSYDDKFSGVFGKSAEDGRSTEVTNERQKESVIQNPKIREEWCKQIGVKELKEKQFICSLHFEANCIEQYLYGNELLGRRSRLKLKEGSIPTIFAVERLKDTPTGNDGSTMHDAEEVTVDGTERGNAEVNVAEESSASMHDAEAEENRTERGNTY